MVLQQDEEEEEEEPNNDESYEKINLERAIAENGDSSTLDLPVHGLGDEDLKIIRNMLQNNKVSTIIFSD